MFPLLQVVKPIDPSMMISMSVLALLVIKESFSLVKTYVGKSSNGNGSSESTKIDDIKGVVIQTKDAVMVMGERQRTSVELQQKTAETLQAVSTALMTIHNAQTIMLSALNTINETVVHRIDDSNGELRGIKSSIKVVSDKFDAIEREQIKRFGS